jgi:hypothetical protein
VGNLSADEVATRQTSMFQQQATLIGATLDEVKQAWADGKDFKTLASEKGVTEAQLQAKMKTVRDEQMKAHLATLVTWFLMHCTMTRINRLFRSYFAILIPQNFIGERLPVEATFLIRAGEKQLPLVWSFLFDLENFETFAFAVWAGSDFQRHAIERADNFQGAFAPTCNTSCPTTNFAAPRLFRNSR